MIKTHRIQEIVSVSIIAANYNNGSYLKDFINSINNSSVLPNELIIVDDGSTDDSLKTLSEFSELKYLKVIKFEKNRGFCEALNTAVEKANSAYVMRVDPDDIVLKSRIKTQFDYLEKNKDIDVVGSNVIYFQDETKKDIVNSNFPIKHKSIKAKYIAGEHGVQHPATMIRASVMKKYKYLQENFKAEDYEIFALMVRDGHRFANIKESLTRMRVHNQSVSNNIKFETIKRTYEIRDEIFNTSTNQIKMRFYYWYILNYKKFLITNNGIMKPIYLLLSIIFYPSKFLKRLF